jgi:hypothetical protein
VVFDEQNFPAKDDASSHLPSKINAVGDLPFPTPVSFLPFPSNSSPISDFHSTNPASSVQSIIHHNELAAHSPINTSTSSFPILTEPAASPPPIISSEPAPVTQLSTSSTQPTQLASHNSSPSTQPVQTSASIPPLQTSMHPMTTRSKTGSHCPKQFPGFKLYKSTKYPLKMLHV